MRILLFLSLSVAAMAQTQATPGVTVAPEAAHQLSGICDTEPVPAQNLNGVTLPAGYRILHCNLPAETNTQAAPQTGGQAEQVPTIPATPPQVPDKTTAPVTLPPSSWFGAGALYSGAQSPHYAGWGAMCLAVATNTCSFTIYQAVPVLGHTPNVLTTTGIWYTVYSIKTSRGVFEFGGALSAGAATGSTAVSLALANGGGIVFKNLKGVTFEAVGLQDKVANGSPWTILVGGGYAWGH